LGEIALATSPLAELVHTFLELIVKKVATNANGAFSEDYEVST
jgi:hypothetical protein